MKDWVNKPQTFFWKQQEQSYKFDQELNQTLISMATQEQCSPSELASRLLHFALQEYKKIQYHCVHWNALSSREQQVAVWICKGSSNQEIALSLGISPDTVKTHVHNILNKFGLRKKQELRMALEGWDFSAWTS